MAPPRPAATQARRVEVRGVVHGVGFRPFISRLAERHGVRGWVRTGRGVVEILAEGEPEMLDTFCVAISAEAPPLAHVENVRVVDTVPTGLAGFEIEPSREVLDQDRLIPPDAAPCEACVRELFDAHDRRYRYPFINCADCGPRFTIMEGLPYDRELTSMRSFAMCEDCRREYEDPANRRFHAEPIACPECGPQLALRDRAGRRRRIEPIAEAARLLLAGKIIALKVLGGFHLACDATNERAVAELRRRKGQPSKPFGVMAADLDMLRELFDASEEEEAALAAPSAPIVLVRDRDALAPSVAPCHRRQGAMLPSTPLHHLLLRAVERPLVMTSGNRSAEPICRDGEEAFERLNGIADAYLVHDQTVVNSYDDSVVRVWRGEPVVLRRGRSFAPVPFALAEEVVPTLGVGTELDGAYCLAAGSRAYLSQRIGDLDSEQAMGGYRAALERAQALFGIEPEVVAHDLDPDLATTRLAEETGLPGIEVQHHHAHVASVMAEHRLIGRVIGVVFDGSGLGEDGTAWGGEFFVGEPARFERAAHLRPVALPGGDAAVRDPWRVAVAYASDADVLDLALPLLRRTDAEIEVVLGQLRTGMGCPSASSVGRLFDAVAALTGVCDLSTYEGQPAIWLEQAAEPGATREYLFDVEMELEGFVMDPRPLVAAVVRDLTRGRPAGEVAGRFHRTMAAATLEICRGLRGSTGLDRVCLSGGVFQNDLLTSDLIARLETVGFHVSLPRQAPLGDGGIALGQVLVANARIAGGQA